MRAVALAAGTVAALVIAEIALVMLLHVPAAVSVLPARARSNISSLYFNRLRDSVQFDDRMARWDPEVFYTLRPGAFTLKAPEYSVRVDVNSLGVRDTADALVHPDIVVIGDSFAMGWGVAQHESFPSQLARLTGRKTLDLGVSSYGTVRERILLDRIGAPPPVLVIQYCNNDAIENAAFLSRGNAYHARSQAQYDELVRYNRDNTRYYPGKYLDGLAGAPIFATVWRYEFVLPPWEEAPAHRVEGDEATVFLNALAHAGSMDLSHTKIVVFELKAEHQALDGRFVQAMADELRRPTYPAYLRQMTLIDLSSTLRPEHYFTLDDHLTASGHAALAERIAAALR